ncbi:MAG: TetR/AcrR family transcriptional regulator [Solimonas sp.]
MKRETQRSQQAERVKTEILEAAIRLFARGFDSVAVQDIATAAGYKHSLVLYHFGSKDRLWEQAAAHLMQRFDQLHREHFNRGRRPVTDQQKLRQLLLAFVLALRDLPAYGQILLSEGAQASGRLLWLHRHFFPSVFTEMQFEDARLGAALKKVSLPRSALVGALLYTVVAAPQIARSAEQDGLESPDEIYPISDALAERLVGMMTAFLFSQLDEAPPAAKTPIQSRRQKS